MLEADDEFIKSLARTVIGLLDAVERGDKLEVIAALNALLTTIVEHGTVSSRRGEALSRAVERV